MKNNKTLSEAGFTELKDEQDLKTTNKKILKSSNPKNSDSDKKGWEMKKLGEVCDISAGGDVPKNNFSEIKTEGYYIPIYANGEKNNGLYGYTNIAKITKPSITVSARGTIGFSVKRLEPFFPIVRLIVITPKNEDLDLSYLEYGISKIDFIHSGTSIPQLTVPMIKNYEIPVPPLPEQQRIVAYLDQTFANLNQAKANTLQNIKNAKELFETELQFLMGNGKLKVDSGEWEEKKLKEIGITQTGNTPKTNEPDNYGDYIPFVKPPHFLKDGTIDTKDSFLSEKGLKSGRLFKENTILMVCIGATIGKTGFSTIPVSSNQQINGLTPSKEHEPSFFYYALISKFFQSKVLAEGSGAQATLPIINKSKWENLTIPFPKSLQTQQAIVSKLDALKTQTQALEKTYQTKLNNLEELRSGILKRAFSIDNGELIVDNE